MIAAVTGRPKGWALFSEGWSLRRVERRCHAAVGVPAPYAPAVLAAISDWSWGPEEWTAVGTVVTAGIAAAAAIVAYFQLRQARQLREDQARPFVVVDIVPSEVDLHVLDLVIENVGNTVAQDVRLSFDPPLASSLADYDLAGSVLIREGIPTMPPRRRIEFLFDISHQRLNTDLPKRYDVGVNYTDARGNPVETSRYTLDIGFLFGLEHVTQYGMHHAAKSLREVEKHLKKVTSNKGVRVHAFSGDGEVDETNIEEALTGRRASFGSQPLGDIGMWFGRNVFIREAVRYLRNHKRTP